MAHKQSMWTKELDILKSMGFKFPDNILIRTVEKFEGNMSSVIEKLMNDMKKIKIKPEPKAKPNPKIIQKNKNHDHEWWLYPMLIIIIFPALISILKLNNSAVYVNVSDIPLFDPSFCDEDIYNILWITNANNKNTITRHHFTTNNFTLAFYTYTEYLRQYGAANVYCPEVNTSTEFFFSLAITPKSENMMNFIVDEKFISEKEIVIHFSSRNKQIAVEYGKKRTHLNWYHYNAIGVNKMDGYVVYYHVKDINLLFDFIIAARERNILIDISNLIFISYMDKDKIMKTATMSLMDAEFLCLECPYIKAVIGGNIISSNLSVLNGNERLKLFEYWLFLENKLQNIQDVYDKYNGKLEGKYSVLRWLRMQLLNDKQINDDKVNLLMYYLHFTKDIKNAYDLAVFRDSLLMMDPEMSGEFMFEMRFKNKNEMNLFIKSVLIYMYEMPYWIVGRYECVLYKNSVYNNGYHYVEILHDRNNIGNYIWKTRIGQIWSLVKIDGKLLTFGVGKDSIYYNLHGYTQMSFVINPNSSLVDRAIGQEFEPYLKQSEL